MHTVPVFKIGDDYVIHLPNDMDFEGVTELEISREGDAIILRPVKPSWSSFSAIGKADADFLNERPAVAFNSQTKWKTWKYCAKCPHESIAV